MPLNYVLVKIIFAKICTNTKNNSYSKDCVLYITIINIQKGMYNEKNIYFTGSARC